MASAASEIVFQSFLTHPATTTPSLHHEQHCFIIMSISNTTAAMAPLSLESSQPATTTSPHALKGLMDLPDELWLKICEYAILFDGEIPITRFQRSGQRAAASPAAIATAVAVAQPPIALTCRRIRAEILPLYYGSNIFTISSSQTAAFTLFPPGLDVEGMGRWIGMMLESGWWGCVRNCRFVAPLSSFARERVVGRLEGVVGEVGGILLFFSAVFRAAEPGASGLERRDCLARAELMGVGIFALAGMLHCGPGLTFDRHGSLKGKRR